MTKHLKLKNWNKRKKPTGQKWNRLLNNKVKKILQFKVTTKISQISSRILRTNSKNEMSKQFQQFKEIVLLWKTNQVLIIFLLRKLKLRNSHKNNLSQLLNQSRAQTVHRDKKEKIMSSYLYSKVWVLTKNQVFDRTYLYYLLKSINLQKQNKLKQN